MASFGERLRELRKERGLTQIELANDLNMSYSTISDYERGDKEDLLVSTLRAFANYFMVSVDYMYGDTDVREDISIENAKEIFNKLNQENRAKTISFMEYLRGEQYAEENNQA
jgi:transcriptional regulator with XRE-family HTH domain